MYPANNANQIPCLKLCLFITFKKKERKNKNISIFCTKIFLYDPTLAARGFLTNLTNRVAISPVSVSIAKENI